MSNIEGLPRIEVVPTDIEIALSTPVDTVESVLDNFAEVGPLLEAANLKHVEPFWDIYGDVTLSVYNGLRRGIFHRPVDVAHTLPYFYDYARAPLLSYVRDERESIDPEWARALYDEKVIAAKPGIQFLAHMNSHITNDLARALNQSKVHDDYKRDFTIMVGQKLEEVATQHASTYIPLRTPALRGLTLVTCLKYIDVARERAWRDGKRLQAAQSEHEEALLVEKIKQTSLRQGKILHLSSTMILRSAEQLETVTGRFGTPPRAA